MEKLTLKNLSFVPSTRGNGPALDIVDTETGEMVCYFYENMKGYVPSFCLRNDSGVGYHFPERSSSTQVQEFKKAIKAGFNHLTVF